MLPRPARREPLSHQQIMIQLLSIDINIERFRKGEAFSYQQIIIQLLPIDTSRGSVRGTSRGSVTENH